MSVNDPFTSWPVSCDWNCHRRSGRKGGTDYAVKVGTPIHAPANGVLENAYTELDGHIAFLHIDNYRGIRFLHLSQTVPGGSYKQGDVIGYSGNTGTQTTGPHVHVDGWEGTTRVDWHTFIDDHTTPASSTKPKPTSPPSYEEDMIIISYAKPGNPRNGIVLAGPGFWHKFSGEEWAQFGDQKVGVKNLQGIIPINDRAYDLYKNIFTAQTP